MKKYLFILLFLFPIVCFSAPLSGVITAYQMCKGGNGIYVTVNYTKDDKSWSESYTFSKLPDETKQNFKIRIKQVIKDIIDDYKSNDLYYDDVGKSLLGEKISCLINGKEKQIGSIF